MIGAIIFALAAAGVFWIWMHVLLGGFPDDEQDRELLRELRAEKAALDRRKKFTVIKGGK